MRLFWLLCLSVKITQLRPFRTHLRQPEVYLDLTRVENKVLASRKYAEKREYISTLDPPERKHSDSGLQKFKP